MWYCGIVCGMRAGIGLVWNSVEWHVLVWRAMACFKQQKFIFTRKVSIIFPCVFCFNTFVADICHVLHLDLKCYTRKCKKKCLSMCLTNWEFCWHVQHMMCYRLIARVGSFSCLAFYSAFFFGQINVSQATPPLLQRPFFWRCRGRSTVIRQCHRQVNVIVKPLCGPVWSPI